jgi:pyruvate-ferredoxin/flavodoxin oxidoreductase
MQVCFFALSGVLPRDEAIARIKGAIEKTYGKRGTEVVKRNFAAVDATLAHLHEVPAPSAVTATHGRPPLVADAAPDFVKRVTAVMLAGKGDLLPVSAFPVDGTWPVGTARFEKRNLALDIPVWDPKVCIQCNQCALVCPHAAIRAKLYAPEALAGAPATFKTDDFRSVDRKGLKYTIQVAPEDCTGCTLCVQVCPAKDKTNPRHKAIDMAPQRPLRDAERENYAFFLDLPELDRAALGHVDLKTSQFLEPLFEYSGACAGCGETPYIKLLTQLFGDRALIANATGCSSIYGGNLPTTPYTTNRDGRGPAWANSLFEDNAEFGLGFRLALDAHSEQATQLLQLLRADIGEGLVVPLLEADQATEAGITAQRERVRALRARLLDLSGPVARRLLTLADYLVRKSVWLVGGDGWAYDIGFGGLDHVLSGNRDLNVLVLDTEVYSNTGGQQSKATPLGASAKFAEAGKETPKTLQALQEAEAYPGPSLVIAYSHCIAHGYDMAFGVEQQKLATSSGLWPLYRYDPRRVARGEPPLHLDSGPPRTPLGDYMRNEGRFRVVEKADPRRFQRLLRAAETLTRQRYAVYQQLAGITVPRFETSEKASPASAVEPR